MVKNPFSISFGKKLYQYIERDLVIDEIMEEMSNEVASLRVNVIIEEKQAPAKQALVFS